MRADTEGDTVATPSGLTEAPPAPVSRLKRWVTAATEAHILFPAIAILLLAMIWGPTFNLIRVEREAAEHAAAVSSYELAETYEAQVVRSLREIDQTLKLVKYAVDQRDAQVVLQELRAMSLLPADLLFVVSITDVDGNVIASTRRPELSNVADQDYFRAQRQGDSLVVGIPRKSATSGEWTLQFSRRLNAADESFMGIVMLSVDAGYFVSGYEESQLGQKGVLAIVGDDGISRARRTGESVFAADAIGHAIATLAPDASAAHIGEISASPWDGVARYTSARHLYDFPLTVMVGLSSDERLQAARSDMRTYLLRAAAASVALIIVMAILGRMSRQLAQSRQRAIEEQITHAKRIEYLAYHDGLTGLPNRSMFSKVLADSIKQASRYDRQAAVLFLDLDRFKHINDTLGHEAGDQLLQEVATRLTACLRDTDTVARLGGDEFVVLMPQVSDEKYVATVAHKILSAVARPFLLLGQEFRVTASVGVSIYPRDGLDEQTLTKNADVAMYHAKEGGKNNFQFYSEALNANSLERLTLESGLRHALEQDEFELHYQTKQDIHTGEITGTEALLRWQHPDLGTVAPMKFIPIAEETGLIIPIGHWVLRTACRQNVCWQNQGLPPLSMAVNLTPRQFYDDRLIDDLTTILAETGMDRNLLELEISEGLLMRDVEKTLGILTRLREMGIRVAVDDFGTGYSSLSMLQRFPLDTIKIDRSFIRDIGHAPGERDLTEAIVTMGRTLSLTVVAQGIETKEQADFVRRNACHELQGFYFNRPLPADNLTELLRARADPFDSNARSVDESVSRVADWS